MERDSGATNSSDRSATTTKLRERITNTTDDLDYPVARHVVPQVQSGHRRR